MTPIPLPRSLILPSSLDPLNDAVSQSVSSAASRVSYSGPANWQDATLTKQLVAVWAVGVTTSSLAGNTLGFARTGSVIASPMRQVSDNVILAKAETLETTWAANPRTYFRIPFDVATPVNKGEVITLVYQYFVRGASGLFNITAWQQDRALMLPDLAVYVSSNSGATWGTTTTEALPLLLEFSDGTYGKIGNSILCGEGPNTFSGWGSNTTGSGAFNGRERCVEFALTRDIIAGKVGLSFCATTNHVLRARFRLYEDANVISEKVYDGTGALAYVNSLSSYYFLDLPAGYVMKAGATYRLALSSDMLIGQSIITNRRAIPSVALPWAFGDDSVLYATSNSRTGDATPWGVPETGLVMPFVIQEDAIEAPSGGIFKGKTIVTAAGR